jgi:hypothetical protein
MKLLRDFFHLRLAGAHSAAGHPAALPGDADARVSAPLVDATHEPPAAPEPSPARAARREPASFLRTPRHRRLGSARR